MSLNKVMLIGNVGRDPEVRYFDANSASGQGRKVASFTLATSERYKDRNGETKENTEWHNIVAWGQSADVAEKYIKKGTQLYIEGRIRTRSWTDSAGVKKYTTEINVDSLQLLGRRENSEGGYQGAQNQGYQGGGYQGNQGQSYQSGYQAQGAQPQQGYSQQPNYAQAGYQAPQQAFQAPVQNVQAPAPAAADDTDDLPF